jgi:formylglycine-generating enzyme required for sulfatase activity
MSNSLAERAGVRRGDTILSVNGEELSTPEALIAVGDGLLAGAVARISLRRDGEDLLLSAVVERGVGAPNVDLSADSDESPVHSAMLRPYFLSKYELTQGQWSRCPAEDREPSFYPPGTTIGGKLVTGANPVESISHDECEVVLARIGLTLPTEAQWERACRALTTTPYSCGESPADLEGSANIADRTAFRFAPAWPCTMELDDGYYVHAPVGSFRANGFGLHDMHGNVFEWCRDTYSTYHIPPTAPDGYRKSASMASGCIARGGSNEMRARNVRASNRYRLDAAGREAQLGVRPSRPICP